MENIVIVGGGLAGLFAAYSLVNAKRNNLSITVIEREEEIGGLLRSYNYGQEGQFDHGTHFFQETGITELDNLFQDILSCEEWNYFENNKRDLAGTYFNGKLQYNTQYIDLRKLKNADYKAVLADFMYNLNQNADRIVTMKTASADEQSRIYFGNLITDQYIAPALKKTFNKNITELSTQATYLLPTNRITLFDEIIAKDLLETNLLRKITAYPEQRNLPSTKSSGKSSFYPKKYGIVRVIEALEEKLKKAGVQLLKNTKITELIVQQGKVVNLKVESKQKSFNLEPNYLIWSVSMFNLTSLLGLEIRELPFDKPQKTVLVNMLATEEPKMQDLYYFYCHEPNFSTYRLTNYKNYCTDAIRNGLYPLTAEVLLSPTDEMDIVGIAEKVKQEIKAFGVLTDIEKLNFIKVEPLAQGFPMPTLKNNESMNMVRKLIVEKQLKNVILMGGLSEKELFYQNDILIDSFNKINQLLMKI